MVKTKGNQDHMRILPTVIVSGSIRHTIMGNAWQAAHVDVADIDWSTLRHHWENPRGDPVSKDDVTGMSIEMKAMLIDVGLEFVKRQG